MFVLGCIVGLVVGWCLGCWVTALRYEEKMEDVRAALNTGLAHIEGRTNIFSTRDPRTVAIQLRQALGEHVNEERGQGWKGV